MISHAEISPCGCYRYALWREWLVGEGTVLFVMLNPSTADGVEDDPTIRRCVGFAQAWGYKRLAVANLFAYRSTDPDALPMGPEAVGPDNDFWILRLAAEADLCVAAWGARPRATERGTVVLELLADIVAVHALKLAAGHAPRHPLYLKGTLRPFVLQPLRSLALPVDAYDVLRGAPPYG